MKYVVRAERSDDANVIRQITQAAFALAEHHSGTEGAIIDALRAANALVISLVATVDEEVVGHVAFSPVTIGDTVGWFGLGPVSVRPDLQKHGIGGALIREGLIRLKAMHARGCVVMGDPGYYQRFGFAHDPAIAMKAYRPNTSCGCRSTMPRRPGTSFITKAFPHPDSSWTARISTCIRRPHAAIAVRTSQDDSDKPCSP